METANKSRDTQCPECKEEFKTVVELEEHFIAKHEDGYKHFSFKYFCNQCDHQSRWKYNLDLHINAVHGGIKNYACNQCSYKSAWKNDLQLHIQSKHNGVKYPCIECGKKYM